MPRPKHHINAPGTYFITTQTWERRPIFAKSAVAEILLTQLLHYRRQGAYLLHAFVIMPDHLHALLTPQEDTSLEKAVQLIKGSSSFRIRRELLFRWPVWQTGFYDHRIRDPLDCEKHIRYIAQNPVLKKLAAGEAEYRYSSASGSVELDPLPQGLKPTTVVTIFRTG